MRKYKLLTKAMLGASLLLAGGTVLGNGCANTIASLPICGSILTFCTPGDQINFLWPWLETPDFSVDPSCTIPYDCGGAAPTGSDLFPSIPGGPGGGSTPAPSDTQGGGATGGGGGGGGV
jgi:hypothetical protein